jgi:hypothetical protein
MCRWPIFYVAQARDRWLTLVKTVMKLRISYMVGNFLGQVSDYMRSEDSTGFLQSEDQYLL